MKLHHFSILFVIIAIVVFTITDIKTDRLVSIMKDKESLDLDFNNAIDSAARNLVEVDAAGSLVVNKETAVNDFLLSMYASLNLMNDDDKQKRLQNYIPVIVITCEDGYYLYYSDEYKRSDGFTYISKRWSEKIPYSYEDDDFIYSFTMNDTLTLYDKRRLLDTSGDQTVFTLDYHELSQDDQFENFRKQRPDSFLLNDDKFLQVRRKNIIEKIENSLAYYCNKHNSIAQQFGLSYKFALPVIDNSEWVRSIAGPSIVILFQGYPIGGGNIDTYNRYAIAGSEVTKKQIYYLEQKSWYYVYHKAGCPELKKDGIVILDTPYYSVLDCVKAGAYACPYCSGDTGICAPAYSP